MTTVTKFVLTADTKAVPFETPCQKDVWWNGHIPPHILKIRTEGQLHAPAIVFLGTFCYVA
jgi:hypothetical protein